MVTVCCPKCGTEREIVGTEERVRCANKEDCGKRYYVKDNIVPEIRDKKGQKGTEKLEVPTVNHSRRLPLETVSIDTLETILECMDRGISTIKNKPEVKKKIGAYYWNYVKWTRVWNALKLSYDLKEEERNK